MAIGSINAMSLNGPNMQTSPIPSSDSNAAKEGSYAKSNQEYGKFKKPSESTIKEAVNKMNNQMKHTRCEFNYHENIKMVSIKIIDNDTDEVVKEIPPEKTLEMVEKMWELAGLLVDEKR